MWPTLVDGETVKFEILGDRIPEVGQIVLAKHPFTVSYTHLTLPTILLV